MLQHVALASYITLSSFARCDQNALTKHWNDSKLSVLKRHVKNQKSHHFDANISSLEDFFSNDCLHEMKGVISASNARVDNDDCDDMDPTPGTSDASTEETIEVRNTLNFLLCIVPLSRFLTATRIRPSMRLRIEKEFNTNKVK